MKNFIRLTTTLVILGLSILSPVHGNASTVPYSNEGTHNSDSYTFTATSTGEIHAYFYGSTAAYTNTLTMLVNGVATPETTAGVLNNQLSGIGDFVNLGFVNAGDSITFQLNVLTTGKTWYSDSESNSDGINHVYSTAFLGDYESNIPAGTYVGFEDIFRGGDLDYDDQTFVFTNVSPVPEPETYAMMLAGLMLVGFKLRAERMK